MNSLISIIIMIGLLSIGYGYMIKQSYNAIAFVVIGISVSLIGIIMAVVKWIM